MCVCDTGLSAWLISVPMLVMTSTDVRIMCGPQANVPYELNWDFNYISNQVVWLLHIYKSM